MIWRYTIYDSFNSIENDGSIQPATTYIPIWEKPIVWFSTEQFWEPTVRKGRIAPDGTIQDLSMDGMLEHGILLIRIGIDEADAPHRWAELKLLSGMSPEIARGLASKAKQLGANPSRWRGTFEAVGAEKWKSVEYFDGVAWAPLPRPVFHDTEDESHPLVTGYATA